MRIFKTLVAIIVTPLLMAGLAIVCALLVLLPLFVFIKPSILTFNED